MNEILMNVLVTAIIVGMLAAIAYCVIKPVLRKKIFNTPGIVDLIQVDDETSILVMNKPYTWFAGSDDFAKHAVARHKADCTIDVLCYPSSSVKTGTIVTCYAQAEENVRYDFQKIVDEASGIFGVKSMVILPAKPTKEELIELVKTARID
ncbi:hypothetical protein J6Z39_01185 [bacterium]|nr:hypothetical protein [bacterium]MBP5434413.1 hypothetical protein [bacterium]